MNTQYSVNRDRWAAMSIFGQMGNIGSEVGRALKAKRQHNSYDCEQAVIRALDLFDATVEPLIKQKSARAKEVLRAKDQFLHAVYDDDTTPQAMESIERYFMQFAIAERLRQGA